MYVIVGCHVASGGIFCDEALCSSIMSLMATYQSMYIVLSNCAIGFLFIQLHIYLPAFRTSSYNEATDIETFEFSKDGAVVSLSQQTGIILSSRIPSVSGPQ